MRVPVYMAFEDEINYEKISQINKKERKSSKLVNIDPQFYLVIITHLKKLQEKYNKKYLESPTSTEALLLNNEICKLDNMVKEIYTRRERKIILTALDTNSTPNFKQMLEHEQRLYQNITKILNDYRGEVLNEKPNPSCAEVMKTKSTITPPPAPVSDTIEKTDSTPDTTPPISQDIKDAIVDLLPPSDEQPKQAEAEPDLPDQSEPPKTRKPAKATKVKEESEDTTDKIVVYIMEDLEPFVGTDAVTYNLHKEDIVTIPKSNADILCKNNKARIVESNI